MFGLGRRVIDGAVLFLALYAFCVVPFGKRTGLEHLRAVLRTPAARDAGQDLVSAAAKLRDRLLDRESEAPVRPRGTATVPRLPRHTPPANAAVAPQSLDVPDASQ